MTYRNRRRRGAKRKKQPRHMDIRNRQVKDPGFNFEHPLGELPEDRMKRSKPLPYKRPFPKEFE